MRVLNMFYPKISSHIHFNKKELQAFTLLEVMVALTIFALAVLALVQGLNQSLHQHTKLKESAFAEMVAQNQLEYFLSAKNPEKNGKARLSSYTFNYQIQLESTADEKIKKVIVQVTPQDNPENSYERFTFAKFE